MAGVFLYVLFYKCLVVTWIGSILYILRQFNILTRFGSYFRDFF